MPMFRVAGSFLARRGYWQPFSKTHEAPTPEVARDWAYSEIGGCHGVKRHLIRIDSVVENPSS
jgi:ribosomal protein L20A (L18A)